MPININPDLGNERPFSVAMLKTAPCLDRAKPMRHLRVPSEETQQWLDFCRKKRWIMPSAGVLTFDNGMKGIPILDSAPDEGNEFWQGNSIITAQGLTRGPEHWSDRLNEETLSQIKDTLPKSHEIQGDILMVKIDQSIEEYSQEIAHAMLARVGKKLHRAMQAEQNTSSVDIHSSSELRELSPVAANAQKIGKLALGEAQEISKVSADVNAPESFRTVMERLDEVAAEFSSHDSITLQ